MSKRGFRGKGRGRGPPSKRRRTDGPELSSKQKKHLREYGEFHPADFRDTVRSYSKVEDEKETVGLTSSSSDSESGEEETPVGQLLQLVGVSSNVQEDTSDDDDDDAEDETKESSNEEEIDAEVKEGVGNLESDDEGEEKESDDSENEDDTENDEGGAEKSSSKKPSKRNKCDEDTNHDSDIENNIGSDSKRVTRKSRKDKKVKEKEDDEKEEDEEVEEEEEILEEGEESEHQLKEDDPFSIHFERHLPEHVVEKLSATKWQCGEVKVKLCGTARLLWKDDSLLPKAAGIEKDLKKVGVKHKLVDQVAATNIKECGADLDKHGDILTPLQRNLFSIMNKYQDLLYPRQTFKNIEEIRLTYCLHAVNHVLKTRSRVVAHNTKLKLLREKPDKFEASDVEYRDQGLTRPKVLVVLPTRHAANRVVSLIISLLSASDQGSISKRKRFKDEYGDAGHDDDKKGLKPEDYDATFAGNIDDDFRIGLSLSKKSIRLFSPFYMSDIILASPLGLRRLIDVPHKKGGDYDFLSSIEILILDQTDFFVMQNWDHVLTLFQYMHRQPRESHGVDFSRTRMWTLNGWAQHYRQTLVFSNNLVPSILSVFNKQCHNYAGKVQVQCKLTSGTVCQVAVQLPQMFHKVECLTYVDQHDARFQFFVKEVLPQHKEKDMRQTLIYIPSYYDYTRLRNYFKKEALSFTHISEYDSSKGIRRARIEFKRKKAQFMLYTDRVHFFRRFKLRGPKHLVFYELPQYPHFYSEMCNMLEEPGRMSATTTDALTCTVLYTRFDALKLREVVGTTRANRMIASDKILHMLVSGDAS